MSSDVTYMPRPGCCLCIQACVHTPATKTVELQGRTYQGCSLHAPILEASQSLAAALRMARKHNKIQGGAA